MVSGVFGQRRVNRTPPRPESAAERPCKSGMHVKGVDEVFPDGESRRTVGPTQFCWLTSVRCARRQSCLKSSSNKK